jgi:hypothetical protein
MQPRRRSSHDVERVRPLLLCRHYIGESFHSTPSKCAPLKQSADDFFQPARQGLTVCNEKTISRTPENILGDN